MKKQTAADKAFIEKISTLQLQTGKSAHTCGPLCNVCKKPLFDPEHHKPTLAKIEIKIGTEPVTRHNPKAEESFSA